MITLNEDLEITVQAGLAEELAAEEDEFVSLWCAGGRVVAATQSFLEAKFKGEKYSFLGLCNLEDLKDMPVMAL